MRRSSPLRDRLSRAIDRFASEMVGMFLTEARRALASPRHPAWVQTVLDDRCLPANTNASPWVDTVATVARTTLPPDPAFVVWYACAGLIVEASMRPPSGSTRPRPPLRCAR
jgi:hypothetical protein